MLVDRVLRVRQVCDAIGLSRTTLWRWVRDGNFPKPVRLGSNAIGWRATDVQKWIEDRVDAA